MATLGISTQPGGQRFSGRWVGATKKTMFTMYRLAMLKLSTYSLLHQMHLGNHPRATVGAGLLADCVEQNVRRTKRMVELVLGSTFTRSACKCDSHEWRSPKYFSGMLNKRFYRSSKSTAHYFPTHLLSDYFLLSACPLLSAYFLTVSCYKPMS